MTFQDVIDSTATECITKSGPSTNSTSAENRRRRTDYNISRLIPAVNRVIGLYCYSLDSLKEDPDVLYAFIKLGRGGLS